MQRMVAGWLAWNEERLVDDRFDPCQWLESRPELLDRLVKCRCSVIEERVVRRRPSNEAVRIAGDKFTDDVLKSDALL